MYAPQYLTISFKKPIETQLTFEPITQRAISKELDKSILVGLNKEVFKAQIEEKIDLSSYVCKELHLTQDTCDQIIGADWNMATE